MRALSVLIKGNAMLTASERHLRLRFLRFVRYELLHISRAPYLFRRDYWRLNSMIASMHLSSYLTNAQAATLEGLATTALSEALKAERIPSH